VELGCKPVFALISCRLAKIRWWVAMPLRRFTSRSTASITNSLKDSPPSFNCLAWESKSEGNLMVTASLDIFLCNQVLLDEIKKLGFKEICEDKYEETSMLYIVLAIMMIQIHHSCFLSSFGNKS
jgi:hypothetical protein